VQEVVFSFVDGKLFRITVSYDRFETAGLTAGDIIGALSANYGTAASLPANVEAEVRNSGDQELVLSEWKDLQYRFALTRTPYGPTYRLTGVMIPLEAQAQAAITEATRLDDLDAPRRTAARIAGELETERLKLEKARVANKAKFRP
jgi:hypothetical protein